MYSYSKKIIGFIFVGIYFCSTLSFAKDDCENTGVNSGIVIGFEKFLNKEDFEVARNHLISYCCVEKPNLEALSGKCDSLVFGPESPYWYDHLVDVGLRRLDAEFIYPGMTVDPDGKAWRDFIKNPDNITNPTAFLNEYKKYWTLKGGYLFSINTIENRTNTSFDSLETLHDKYLNYCFVTLTLYEKMGLNNLDIVFDGYYDSCLSMVKARIRQETVLAMNMAEYQSSSLLLGGLTAYTKQFSQNRLMKLYDKLVAISSYFNILAKQAPLTNKCTK